MKEQTKKIVIASSIIGALVIVGGAILLRNKRKKLEALIKSGSGDVLIPASKTDTSILFPINFASGDSAADKNAIKVVQRYLNSRNTSMSLMNIPLSEDGIFGTKTRSMLLIIEGVSEVSSSLYQSMVSFLSSGGYSGTDPAVLKNDLIQ
jgi:hypothetical protein